MMLINWAYIFVLFILLGPLKLYAQSVSRSLPGDLLRRSQSNHINTLKVDSTQSSPFSMKAGYSVLTQNSVDESISENDSNRVGAFNLKTQPTISSETHFVKSKPLVLLNQRTKSVGVLTGTFELKLKSNQDLNSILDDHNLVLIQGFTHISRFYVSPKDEVSNLKAIHQTLIEDERVTSVQLEILDRTYDKK